MGRKGVGFSGTTIKDTWTKSRVRVEMGEGGEIKKKITTMRYHRKPIRMAIKNNSQTINFGELVEKREPWYTVGGGADWCSHCGKQCGFSSEN